jgi:anti-sigma regulatory factor (Ser/Thr protein kinase)
MIRSFFFVLRLLSAWAAVMFLLVLLVFGIFNSNPPEAIMVPVVVVLVLVAIAAISHLRRVRLIAGTLDSRTLSNRQRRQIEIPFEAGESFDLLVAAIAELPGVSDVKAARDSLQVRARLDRLDPYGAQPRVSANVWLRATHNQLLATVTPNADTGSVLLICEPEAGAWSDLFRVDDGSNLENAEAVARAITRRVAERRRGEQADVAQTHTEKELTAAKLSLLHAQVEPHFLYNTLASAQYLTRTDPQLADQMLGNLITYLRHSLPRTDTSPSTLGEEVERARAYLEILKLRMGQRLQLQIDVPHALLSMPFPAMMLQTLVENAIKHGLEPPTAGGTVWILAKESDGRAAVTVADDGQGLGASTSAGTGIGLKNVRERLRLAYGGDASLSVVANFPSGVAATITVPASAAEGAAS